MLLGLVIVGKRNCDIGMAFNGITFVHNFMKISQLYEISDSHVIEDAATSWLKMEAVCSSEMLISTFRSTRHYNP
jgi:hypothetical protein